MLSFEPNASPFSAFERVGYVRRLALRMNLAPIRVEYAHGCIVKVELGDDARPRHVTHDPQSSPRRPRLSTPTRLHITCVAASASRRASNEAARRRQGSDEQTSSLRAWRRSALTFAKGCASIRPMGQAARNALAPAARRILDRAKSRRPAPSYSRYPARPFRPVRFATTSATRRQCAGVRPAWVVPSGRITSRSRSRASL